MSPSSVPISKKTGCNAVFTHRLRFFLSLIRSCFSLSLSLYTTSDINGENFGAFAYIGTTLFLQQRYLQSIAHLSLYGTPFAKDAAIIRVQLVQTVLLLDETRAYSQQIA